MNSLLSKGYIISDNFYPKKLTKYTCPTLTNINIYETPNTNKTLVFTKRSHAKTYLSNVSKLSTNLKYNIYPINKDELEKLKMCFNYDYLFIY